MKKKFSEILLVDDDGITNYITMNLLLEIDIADKITVQQSGQEALFYIKANWLPAPTKAAPRLILLDINMPLMSGFEFLDHFSLLGLENVRIFILTTSESSKDMEIADRHKIKGYLIKPLETNPSFIDEMKKQVFTPNFE